MKLSHIFLCFLVVSLAGCSNFLHTERQRNHKDGYSHVKHVIEFETEPVCNGSCAVKNKE